MRDAVGILALQGGEDVNSPISFDLLVNLESKIRQRGDLNLVLQLDRLVNLVDDDRIEALRKIIDNLKAQTSPKTEEDLPF